MNYPRVTACCPKVSLLTRREARLQSVSICGARSLVPWVSFASAEIAQRVGRSNLGESRGAWWSYEIAADTSESQLLPQPRIAATSA